MSVLKAIIANNKLFRQNRLANKKQNNMSTIWLF